MANRAATPPAEGAGTPNEGTTVTNTAEGAGTPTAPAATTTDADTNVSANAQSDEQAAGPLLINETVTGTDKLSVEADVILDVIEMEITRVDAVAEGGEYAFLRAVEHPDASGVLQNEVVLGKNPRAFMELVVKGGALSGELKAGGRVHVTIMPIEPTAPIVM